MQEKYLPKSVTLIRHPRWAGNVEGGSLSLLPSQRDFTLGPDALGVQQAQHLGETALRERAVPDFVIASPYLRAREGARLAVATAWPGEPIFVDIATGLVEQDKGTDPEDYYEDNALFDRKYPDGESLRTAGQRLVDVLTQPEYAGKDVVIFTHARLMLAARIALGRQNYTTLRDQGLPNDLDGIYIDNCQMDRYDRTFDQETEALTPWFIEMTSTQTWGENPQESGTIYIALKPEEKTPPKRSELSDTDHHAIKELLESRAPLINDTARFNAMVADFTHSEPIDPKDVMVTLANCSPLFNSLFQADLGLLRPARLIEHTETDLRGFEDDYRQLFADDSHALQVLRLASLLKDIGKSYCVKETGSNREQAKYNRLVAENLLSSLASSTLGETEEEAQDIKKTVLLLIDQDVIGHKLQGLDYQTQLDTLRTNWPARFAEQLDDFMIVSYLSDASAHSIYRSFTDMETGRLQSPVTLKDRQLTGLFDQPVKNKPLRLNQDNRRKVAEILPNYRVARVLIDDESLNG